MYKTCAQVQGNIKMDLKSDGRGRALFCDSEYGHLAVSLQHVSEASGSVKYSKFLV